MYSDAQTFCIELCKKGLEGLCTCVYGTYHRSYLKEPIAVCERLTILRKNIFKTLSGGITIFKNLGGG